MGARVIALTTVPRTVLGLSSDCGPGADTCARDRPAVVRKTARIVGAILTDQGPRWVDDLAAVGKAFTPGRWSRSWYRGRTIWTNLTSFRFGVNYPAKSAANLRARSLPPPEERLRPGSL